ncbi:hypothetical protein SAICODRAFT_20674 [Saitoella complicata NRRL Y-17804]|uniref:uncharacterized protein n=1 Tax=Saitoella complicata (strain BCRC 22490 / CBS 7301 / JCM 7358 / NBRC 10748 / NRRL Y-17804) TaxID=698492 RepID=UPI0008668C49|nr:uncharacterized protein SAICODRAFT_20674 [Saitoella complicata NRRL Y-17804]ODQ51303.1 hypothetical protein SAICODRAFT_20674 [Saitoella complicata NRRL Y-17804]
MIYGTPAWKLKPGQVSKTNQTATLKLASPFRPSDANYIPADIHNPLRGGVIGVQEAVNTADQVKKDTEPEPIVCDTNRSISPTRAAAPPSMFSHHPPNVNYIDPNAHNRATMQIRSREEILECLTSLSPDYESEIDAYIPISSPPTSPTPLVNEEGSSTSVTMELDAADKEQDQPPSLPVPNAVIVTDTAHAAKVGEEACGAAAFTHPLVPAAEDDLHTEQQETTSTVPKELPSRSPMDVVGTDDVLPSTFASIAMAQAVDMVKNTDDVAQTFESPATSTTTQCHKSIDTSHSLSLHTAEDAGGVKASDHPESPSAAMIVPPQREEETNSTSIERPITPPKINSHPSQPSSIQGAGEQVDRLTDGDAMEDVVFESIQE